MPICILEAELALGVLCRKGGPQKGGTLGSLTSTLSFECTQKERERDIYIYTYIYIFLNTTAYIYIYLPYIYIYIYIFFLSGGANYLPKFLPISFFRCVSRFMCFETFGPPIRKILVYTGMLPCLALHGLKLCKSVSRSDLILISFWMLTMPWNFI